MRLEDKFLFSHRTAIALLSDGSTVAVYQGGQDQHDRTAYTWRITNREGVIEGAGNDLMSGVGTKSSAVLIFGSLLHFLQAFYEASGPGSENYDLFPAGVRSWLDDTSNLHDLEMIDLEIERQYG